MYVYIECMDVGQLLQNEPRTGSAECPAIVWPVSKIPTPAGGGRGGHKSGPQGFQKPLVVEESFNHIGVLIRVRGRNPLEHECHSP